jgi:hypothetical protein
MRVLNIALIFLALYCRWLVYRHVYHPCGLYASCVRPRSSISSATGRRAISPLRLPHRAGCAPSPSRRQDVYGQLFREAEVTRRENSWRAGGFLSARRLYRADAALDLSND